MATLQQLEQALINADRAGDMDAARRLAVAVKQARQDSANMIPGTIVPGSEPQAPEPTFDQQVIGAGETALTLATGATGGMVGTIGGALKGMAQQVLSGQFGTREAQQMVEQSAMQGAQALTYAPRGQAGQQQVQAVGGALQGLPAITPAIGPVGALASGAGAAVAPVTAAAKRVGAVAQKAAGAAASAVRPKPTGVAQLGGSMGAASADLTQMRVEAAKSLPVPIELTKGAATRDAATLAFEKEQLKSADFGSPLRKRAEDNNRQILANADAFFDMTGAEAPDIVATGRSVTAALASGLAQAKTRTRVAYKNAENSAESAAPVDTTAIIDHINSKPAGLHSTKLLDDARRYAVKLGLADDAGGTLVPKRTTVGVAEAFRREVSEATGFDSPDIRNSAILKDLVDGATEPVAGPLYKHARALRREQAEKFENRAIVADLINNRKGMADPKVAVDRVFNRTILGGSPDELQFLRRTLQTGGENGRQAWKELQGAAVNHIKDGSTGTDSAGRQIVSTVKMHKAIEQLDKNGRLDIIFGKKGAAQMRLLDEVAQYVNTVPPGTLINNSGTAATLMAALAEAGALGATIGLPVPVVTGLRQISQMVKDRKLRSKIEATLNPNKAQ